MMETLKHLDWTPFYISLKTGIVATIVCFFLGIFTAWWVMKARSKVRVIVDGILTLPLVLPPTVAGFFLLLLFLRRQRIIFHHSLHLPVIQASLPANNNRSDYFFDFLII